jgi:putative ABC transport system ATP-binding protein
MRANKLAVDCRHVEKDFGAGDTRVQVLRGVNFTARQGELTFLVGPSGCGKTTLISVIAGLLNSNSGEVELFGENIERLPGAERIRFRRKNLGFVYQQYNLLPALTASENAAVPLLAAGVPLRKAVEKAKELLVKLGLEDRLNAPPTKLSGGEQQRVTLARALVHEPRLILCDEPTAALDHATGDTVMSLLASNALGPERAVVVVTHDSRVFHYADSIAHMDDGRIVKTESGKRTPASAPLEGSYMGKASITPEFVRNGGHGTEVKSPRETPAGDEATRLKSAEIKGLSPN